MEASVAQPADCSRRGHGPPTAARHDGARFAPAVSAVVSRLQATLRKSEEAVMYHRRRRRHRRCRCKCHRSCCRCRCKCHRSCCANRRAFDAANAPNAFDGDDGAPGQWWWNETVYEEFEHRSPSRSRDPINGPPVGRGHEHDQQAHVSCPAPLFCLRPIPLTPHCRLPSGRIPVAGSRNSSRRWPLS